MINVTLRQLAVFADAAETLSFARVAERRRLTPSAVSFQIRQIEQQTGLALFERIGRRVALTDAGVVLRTYARQVLAAVHDLDQAMAVLTGAGGGTVRLGLVSTAKYIVPHLIARFRASHPGVVVQVQEGNRTAIFTNLLNGAIDLAIMGQPPEDALTVAERFAAHPSVLIAPAAHPLLARAGLNARDLAAEPFVLREEGSGTRSLADAFFRDAGFTPRVALASSSNEMIKQFVMAGMGLAVISRHTINLEVSLGLLGILSLAGAPPPRAWFAVHRRSAPPLPAHTAFRRFLLGEAQAIIDGLAQGGNAGGRNRTDTLSPEPDFESGASTSSTTPARRAV